MTIQSLLVRLEPDQLRELARLVAVELHGTKQHGVYTINEAAGMLRLHHTTVRKRVAAGLIKPIPNTNNSRISSVEIDRLLGVEAKPPG